MSQIAVAITAPATRRSLRRRWLVVVALAVAGIALLVAAGAKARSDADAAALQHDGTHADATIVAVDAKPVGRGRAPDGSVTVRFDADGQGQQRSVYVAGAIVDYQLDEEVTVVYDAGDPTRVELLGVTTAGRGLSVVPALVVGALLAAMALIAGRRARQLTRVVRHHPWVIVASELVQVPRSYGFRQGSRTLVVLETPDGPVRVEAAGLSRVDPTFAPYAWVAGLDHGPIALGAPGGGHVIAVKRW